MTGERRYTQAEMNSAVVTALAAARAEHPGYSPEALADLRARDAAGELDATGADVEAIELRATEALAARDAATTMATRRLLQDEFIRQGIDADVALKLFPVETAVGRDPKDVVSAAVKAFPVLKGSANVAPPAYVSPIPVASRSAIEQLADAEARGDAAAAADLRRKVLS